MQKIKSKEQNKIPSYVPIYNVLYDEIVRGVYPEGSLLPSENQLAKKYEISRNTLRQALTILTQDGYIYKRQGKGTFISKHYEKTLHLEKFYNFLLECALEPIKEVKMKYNIGAPTAIAKEKLRLEAGEKVFASNNVYIGEKPIGQSFVQIPMNYLKARELSVKEESDLYELLHKRIYKDTSHADLTTQVILAGEEECKFLKCEEGTVLLFIEQVLFGIDGYTIARIKNYFLQDKYQVFCKM